MSALVHTSTRSAAFDVIVMVASLGGPSASSLVLGGLPADFGVPIVLVQHRRPRVGDQLPRALLSRARLPVRAAVDQERLARGVSVLPARHTAAFDADERLCMRASDTFRTADPLLASVAAHYGPRALCVVLTGRLDDAAEGVRALKRHGGRTIVEDPTTAQAGAMPAAALATGCVDLVMPLARISHTLIALTMAPGAADLFRTVPSSWARIAA